MTERLVAIMARLRDPVDGCEWDRAQDFRSIAPYTIEEAYEVADACERGDMTDLKDELGDLLLQVVFHSRMAEEAGAFALSDVVAAISEKMERRHPHIFGDRSDGGHHLWESIKAEERAAKPDKSALAGVALGLPALSRADKLQKRAARVGFDWPSAREVLDKLREETAEIEVEIAAGDMAKAREELGDILFVCANLARKLDVDPEDALRATNAKFTRRFDFVEARLAERGKTPDQSDLEEMDGLWNDAKAAEKKP